MNMVITGDTTVVAKMPTGEKLLNIYKEMGAVKTCAPVDEPKELAK